jgi:type II secretory pathway predicted ATPase ExeA
VAGRLGIAGASAPLFSQDAAVALHRAADGLPRRLNRLADLALLIAYAQDLSAVDSSVIAIAAREFHKDVAA